MKNFTNIVFISLLICWTPTVSANPCKLLLDLPAVVSFLETVRKSPHAYSDLNILPFILKNALGKDLSVEEFVTYVRSVDSLSSYQDIISNWEPTKSLVTKPSSMNAAFDEVVAHPQHFAKLITLDSSFYTTLENTMQVIRSYLGLPLEVNPQAESTELVQKLPIIDDEAVLIHNVKSLLNKKLGNRIALSIRNLHNEESNILDFTYLKNFNLEDLILASNMIKMVELGFVNKTTGEVLGTHSVLLKKVATGITPFLEIIDPLYSDRIIKLKVKEKKYHFLSYGTQTLEFELFDQNIPTQYQNMFQNTQVVLAGDRSFTVKDAL